MNQCYLRKNIVKYAMNVFINAAKCVEGIASFHTFKVHLKIFMMNRHGLNRMTESHEDNFSVP